MTQVDPRDLRDLAADVATAAGVLLADAVAGERDVASKSTPTDAVTDMDYAAERLIVDSLLSARPGDAILGEEGGERAGDRHVRWVIDPLDGTVNYLYRIPAFAVAIAAEVKGELVAGVVHDAARGETLAAAVGLGATCNGRPIRPSGQVDLATALLGTGFAYDAATRAVQGQVLAAMLPRVRDVRRGGSAALDLCWVACGRLDGYYERGLHPWDSAAASLIVREATGQAALEPDGTWVAAGDGLYDTLRAAVRAASARVT